MIQNNYLYFGKYKIRIKILPRSFNNIKKIIKSYMYIQKNKDEDSLTISINKKDKDKALSYLIAELTNIPRIHNNNTIEYLENVDDKDLKATIEYLDNFIIGLMQKCQNDIIQMISQNNIK